MTPEKKIWIYLAVIYLFVCALTTYLISQNNSQYSATFDEPFYLKAGDTYIKTKSNKMLMKAGTMPLPIILASRCVQVYCLVSQTQLDLDKPDDFAVALKISRYSTLFFWWMLLLFVLLLAIQWGGPIFAIYALCAVGYEPNLLAHAGLATTDIALTAYVVFSAYYYTKSKTEPKRWKRILYPGIAYGFALSCKASALAFVPLIWLAICLTHPQLTKANAKQWLKEFIWQGIVSLIILFLLCGSDWQQERTFVEWAKNLPAGILKNIMQPISENLRIFTNAGEGLAQQIKHNSRGHGTYLMGEWYPRAVWYYFPVALWVKLNPIVWLLISVNVYVILRKKYDFIFTHYIPVFVICLILFLFSMTCRVQIGIRLILPLVVFLMMASVIVIHEHKWGKRLFLILFMLNAFFSINQTDFLRYTNPIIGEKNLHQWLSDSNNDWGQSLPLLADLAARNKKQEFAVWYYGMDPRAELRPFRKAALHYLPDDATEAQFEAIAGQGQIAVSSSILYDNPQRSAAGVKAIAWLRSKRLLIAQVGPWFIFE